MTARRRPWNPVSIFRRATRNGRYLPEIDGLRFIGISIVILGHIAERVIRFHGEPISTGTRWLLAFPRPAGGVLILFAISGFVVALPFINAPSQLLSSVALRQYAIRRLFRIAPPYWFIILVTFLLMSMTRFQPAGTNHFTAENGAISGGLALTLLQSYWVIGSFPPLFPPGWSSEIEAQFYLMFPVLVYFFALARWTNMRLVLSWVALPLWIGLSALVARDLDSLIMRTITYYLPYFWLGMLLAARWTAIQNVLRDRPNLCSTVGFAGLLLAVAANMWNFRFLDAGEPVFTSIMLVSITAMFCGVASSQAIFYKINSLPMLTVIGSMTYSLYLTHLQTIHLLAMKSSDFLHGFPVYVGFVISVLIQSPLVLAVAVVFFIFVERPSILLASWLARSIGAERPLTQAEAIRALDSAGPKTALGRSLTTGPTLPAE